MTQNQFSILLNLITETNVGLASLRQEFTEFRQDVTHQLTRLNTEAARINTEMTRLDTEAITLRQDMNKGFEECHEAHQHILSAIHAVITPLEDRVEDHEYRIAALER